MTGICNGLEAIVVVNLRCVETGMESRESAKQDIVNYVKENYVPAADLPTFTELPITVLTMLHETMGLGFPVHAGKLIGVTLEGGI